MWRVMILAELSGMIGLPMDIRPVFPKDQQVVLLTAQAAQAPELMTDIRKQLQSGRDVVIQAAC